MLVGTIAALPVGAAVGGPQIVGVTPGQQLLAIDADGTSTTLFEGNALGGQKIAWSPDGSFAYVLARGDAGLLLFDGTAIERRLPIANPGNVSFHPTRPLALVRGSSYSVRAPLYVVDTRSHMIVADLSVRRSGSPWVVSADGKWAAGHSGDLIDLERLRVRDIAFCDDDFESEFAPVRAWRSDEFLVECRRYLVRFQASTGLELDRVYFRDGLQGFAILPGDATAMVVTLSGIARVRLPDLRILEILPFPESVGSWSDSDRAWFSQDGSVVDLGNYDYFRTSDLTPIEVSRWSGGFPLAAELTGVVEFSGTAWRQSDRSYYRVGDDLVRVGGDTGERTVILPNRRVGGALWSASQPFGYALFGDPLEVQRVSLSDGPMGLPFQLFDAAVDYRSLQAVVTPRGDAIHYGRPVEPDSYRVEALEYTDGTSLGSIVVGADLFPDLEYGDEPHLRALSRTEAVLLSDYYPRYAFVDLREGRVTDTGGGVDFFGRFADAARDPAGPGAFLLLATGFGDEVDVPVIQYVAPGADSRDLWHGRDHFMPRFFVVHPNGGEIYVVQTASQGGHQSVAIVDVATGTTVEEISFPSWIRGVALSSNGGQLVVALDEEPHLVVVDTAARALLGAVRDSPRLERLVLFSGDGFDAEDLVADPLLPATPVAPDVVLFENSVIYGSNGETRRSVAVAGSSLLTEVPLRPEHDRYFSLSVARGGRIAYLADWRLTLPGETYVDGVLAAIDLDAGTVVETALDPSLGWMVADPQGDVAYSVAAPSGGDRLVVSVVDLGSGEIVHSLETAGKLPFRRLVLSPDGTYLVASHDPLVIVDTRDSRVMSYELSLRQPPALTDDYVYFTLPGDGRWLWRMPINGGGEPQRIAQVGRDPGGEDLVAAAPDGQSVIVASRDYNRFKTVLVVRADGTVSEIAVDQSSWSVEGVALSADGERLYVSSPSSIEGFEVDSGARIARIPIDEESNHLVIGCAGSCPTPRQAPPRTPWRDRGTLTPTPVRTPSPTAPTDYEWFEIDPITARPGDLVEIALRHRSTVDRRRPIALRHELILPPILELQAWLDGTLDCEGWYTPWDRDDNPVTGRFELRDDDCPSQGGGCQRLSVIAASAWERDAGEVVYRCRARVADDAPAGTFTIDSENLVVESWDPAHEPFVRPGVVTVGAFAGRPKSPPATDIPPPLPRQNPFMTLRGSSPGGQPGEEVGIGFTLNSTQVLPGGELVAQVEVPDGLSVVLHDNRYPRCGVNYAADSRGGFEVIPGDCESGTCSILTVAMHLETGSDNYDWEQTLNWLQWFDLPIFECRYVIATDVEAPRLFLPVRRASLAGEPLDTEPGVVHVDLPAPTATPPPPATPPSTTTPTPSPTATFVSVARPCEPLQAGRGIVCIDDIEAAPGQSVQLAIRFRSAGASYAGLEFEIRSEVLTIAGESPAGLAPEGVACRVEPAARKDNSAFARTSVGAVKALVISFSDLSPIPDDIVVVRCAAATSRALSPGSYGIFLDLPGASDPEGVALPLDVQSGVLRVPGAVEPTPSATAIPATATPQVGGRPVEGQARSASSSGCQIESARDSGAEMSGASAWMILIVILHLFATSRRTVAPSSR